MQVFYLSPELYSKLHNSHQITWNKKKIMKHYKNGPEIKSQVELSPTVNQCRRYGGAKVAKSPKKGA